MPAFDRSVSSLSMHSDSDWDCSTPDLPRPTTPQRQASSSSSIVFPATQPMDPENEHTPRRRTLTDVHPEPEMPMPDARKQGKRTLSDLLCRRLGSASEAHRIADVLGQWINASSSPYEPDTDDFFVAPSSASTPASPMRTPHTPRSSHSTRAFDELSMSTAPGRRGSITNRGGVTVVAPPNPREAGDVISLSSDGQGALTQPPTRPEVLEMGQQV